MKRTSYLLSILFLAVLTIFTACKDDGVPTPEPGEEETQHLTGGAWTVNSITLAPDNAAHSFEGPVTISFQENKTFTITGATELPNPTAAPTDNMPASGSWEWTNDNFNAISLTSGGTTVPLTITTLSESALTFTYAGAIPKPEDNVTVTVSATR